MEQRMSDMSTVALPDYPELKNFHGRSFTEEQQAKLIPIVETLRPYHEKSRRLADKTPEEQKELLLLLKMTDQDEEAEPPEGWFVPDPVFWGAINALHHIGASLTPPAVVVVPRTEEEQLCDVLTAQTKKGYRRHITTCFSVNGIYWPLPHVQDSDHTAVLRDCCKAAFHALDKVTAANGSEGVPAWKTVLSVLPIVAEKVAALTEREPPSPPSNAQDADAARRYVETVVTWCDPTGKESFVAESPSPADEAGQMQAAIARERMLQRIMRNGLHQDNFNWQAGVDRLWNLGDDLFSDIVPEPALPDKPVCTTYLEARKAAIALQDTLPKGVGRRLDPAYSSVREGAAKTRGDATRKVKGQSPRRTVNSRMLETSQKIPAAVGWSARKWAEYLHCAESTVADTRAWKDWEAARFMAKAARAKDRKRRPNKVNEFHEE
jgi:hypothetical protein